MCIEDFHGPHPDPPDKGCTRIDWREPEGRAVSIRVRAHTCDREPTRYELCVAGGLSHIRRTRRTSAGDQVRESPWVRMPEGQRLWDDLLSGRAR
ncbi:hypothetical protein HCN51_52000 [Nonomuraea sp. FMUSA5-5]|uniref:Uncharacterized protein n=1 Tax=Nonomuraea composti TaxID=2720023 RepID=A0ABX1BJG3_9ACTN|nr:hypothetical protein [Nonomuraea sp. FMUSA5-5]NJP97856.1 hypothetical protein [Nonomuraea sp. FMUSA5-5]